MVKNLLTINGHPDKKSFCYALAESYKKGADFTPLKSSGEPERKKWLEEVEAFGRNQK